MPIGRYKLVESFAVARRGFADLNILLRHPSTSFDVLIPSSGKGRTSHLRKSNTLPFGSATESFFAAAVTFCLVRRLKLWNNMAAEEFDIYQQLLQKSAGLRSGC